MATQQTQDKLMEYGGLAVLAVGGFFLGRKFLREFKKEGAEAELATDQSAQQAQAFRTAFNTSGNSWLMAADGTDNVKVFQLATEVKDLAKVQQYYKDLYKSSLTDDLGSELNSTELARFWAIINGKNAKTQASAKAKAVLAANKFKFKIGDKLNASPLKGNTKIGYAFLEKGAFKIAGWHSLPNTYAGTVTGFVKAKIKDYDGVSRYLSGYYVKDLPNGTTFGSRKIFVLEREVTKG
jgi:hypothetical protein